MTEEIDDAVKNAADNVADQAAHESEAAKAETTEHLANASEAATNAAEAATALANINAAKTIADTRDDLEWLHQHATKTENSLAELGARQTELAGSIPAMLEQQQQTMMEKLTVLLTPAQSMQQQTQDEATQVIPQNEDEADRETKSREKKKPKIGLKHRENWI